MAINGKSLLKEEVQYLGLGEDEVFPKKRVLSFRGVEIIGRVKDSEKWV